MAWKNIALGLTLLFASLPAVTLMAQESVVEKPALTAASNMRHPPFSSWDENNAAVGIEVEIVETAASDLGFRVNWVEMEFADLLKAVESGEVDIAVSTIGVTEQRKKQVSFSDPYYETEIVALVRPDSDITTLDQLAKRRIGADQATTSFAAAKQQWPEAALVPQVMEGLTWPEMIQEGHIDAFVVDASDQHRLESTSDVQLRRIESALSSEHFAVAVRKDASELLAAMNRSVKNHVPDVPLWIGGQYQFTTPMGVRLSSLVSPRKKLLASYFEARTRYRNQPDDADAIIWYGRRAGYLFRLNEAIEIFSEGIQKHPDDPGMYRHRGHRYISTRQFDKAIADFEKAASLIEDTADQVEPDGAPNAQGIRLTTLHGNIWYHLGLAYYLKNDMKNALRCFQKRIGQHRYDDNVVSTGHWTYMILRRLGKDQEAAGVVEKVNAKMTIVENQMYHRTCMFYAGKLTEADISVTSGDQNVDVLRYGLGNWCLYDRKDSERAREIYEGLLENGSPYSFAFIAAEADYVRLFTEGEKK